MAGYEPVTPAPSQASVIGDVLMLRDDATGVIVAKHLRTGTRVRLSLPRGRQGGTVDGAAANPQRVLRQLATLVQTRAAAIATRWALINVPIPEWWIAKLAVLAHVPWSWRWTMALVAIASSVTALAAFTTGLAVPDLQNVTARDWMLIAGIHAALLVCHEIAHAIVLLHWGGRPRQLKLLVSPGVLMAVDGSDLYVLPRVQHRIQVVLAGPIVDVVAVVTLFWMQWAMGGHWSILLWLQGILLVIGLWPFAYTDGYVLCAAVFDTPGLNRVSRDCLISLLKGRSDRLRAEAAVRGWPAIGALCAYAAVAAVAKWLPGAILLWFLFPYILSAMRVQ